MKHIRWKGGERVPTKVDGGEMKGEIEDEVMEKKSVKERDNEGC